STDADLLSSVETELAQLEEYVINQTIPTVAPLQIVSELKEECEIPISIEEDNCESYCPYHCEPACNQVCQVHCDESCLFYTTHFARQKSELASQQAQDDILLQQTQLALVAIAVEVRNSTLPSISQDSIENSGKPNNDEKIIAAAQEPTIAIAIPETETTAVVANEFVEDKVMTNAEVFLNMIYILAIQERRKRIEAKRIAEEEIQKQRDAQRIAREQQLLEEANCLMEQHEMFMADAHSRSFAIALVAQERLKRELASQAQENKVMLQNDLESASYEKLLAVAEAHRKELEREINWSIAEVLAMAEQEKNQRAVEAKVAEDLRIEAARQKQELLRLQRLEEEAKREKALKAQLEAQACERKLREEEQRKKVLAEAELQRQLQQKLKDERRRQREAEEAKQRAAADHIEVLKREAQILKEKQNAELKYMAAADSDAKKRDMYDKQKQLDEAKQKKQHTSVLQELVHWIRSREQEANMQMIATHLMTLEDRRSQLYMKRLQVENNALKAHQVYLLQKHRWFSKWHYHFKYHRNCKIIQRWWRHQFEINKHTIAASRLQSVFRGYHVRRKIANALQMAKFVDDDEFDYGEVDVDEFLGPVAAIDLEDEPPPQSIPINQQDEEEMDWNQDNTMNHVKSDILNQVEDHDNVEYHVEERVEMEVSHSNSESAMSKLYQRMQRAVKTKGKKKLLQKTENCAVQWSSSGKKAKKVNVPSLVERLRRTTAATR
ncbi:hypothetical protein THRCLA_23075, partial [Thraustotheca clavata]